MSAQVFNIALKEWAVVCRALEAGRQIILLRKGGIYESAGEFEIEHRQFLLFPTYLHQNLNMLKPEAHGGFAPASAEPAHIELRIFAEISDIIELKSRRQMDAIDSEHIWTSPMIDMRFDYRPQNPLYLLVVRAYLLARPRSIENTIAYAGCKSWVPLEEAIDVSSSQPAIDEQQFQRRRKFILDNIGGPHVTT